MPICSYCKKEYDTHRGLTYILSDGTIKYLCSSKCRKNMLMKRRKVRWITKKEPSTNSSSGKSQIKEKLDG